MLHIVDYRRFKNCSRFGDIYANESRGQIQSMKKYCRFKQNKNRQNFDSPFQKLSENFKNGNP